MELWVIIALSVLGTLFATLTLWAICDSISKYKDKKRRQQDWYTSKLKALMDRMDTVECDIDCLSEDIENIMNDIYIEEN